MLLMPSWNSLRWVWDRVGEGFDDRLQRGTTVGEGECVVASGGVRFGSFDEVEPGEEFQPRRQDVGRDVFG